MAQSYAGYVCALAWIPNTIPRPPSKRAVALALINAVTQLGNISGSYMFPDPWGEWGLWPWRGRECGGGGSVAADVCG